MRPEEVNRDVFSEENETTQYDRGVPGDDNVDFGLPGGRNTDEYTSVKLEICFANADNTEPEELSDLLEELVEEVARISEKLPPEEADQLADALERLTKDAMKKRPERDLWEEPLDEIKTVADNMGEIGVTTITLLAEIIPLLEKKELRPKG